MHLRVVLLPSFKDAGGLYLKLSIMTDHMYKTWHMGWRHIRDETYLTKNTLTGWMLLNIIRL